MDTLLAHGLGGRSDLPLNGTAAIVGGGVAVLASFLALTVAWRRPRLRPDGGRLLPAALAGALGSPALTVAGRAAALAAAAGVVAVALAGPPGEDENLAPWALYVTFWVGLVPVSVLAGPVWRRVNPLRTLHAALCRLLRTDPAGRRPPVRAGYWPAAAWLTGFVWLELVAPHRANPRLVGALICGYAAINVAAALRYGSGWFARGDGFEVYSTLLARLCPLGRRPDGRLVVRTPLAGLAGVRPEPGLTAVACVLIGSTAFDGITRTTYWRDTVDPSSVVAGTVGLATAIAVVAVVYLAAMWACAALTASPAVASAVPAGREGAVPADTPAAAAALAPVGPAGETGASSGTPARRAAGRPDAGAPESASAGVPESVSSRRRAAALAGRFAPTLLPIALGYTVAHYFSFLLLEGQMTVILASDPFGAGWDLLGTAGHRIDYDLAGPALVAQVQVNAIVLGHIAATIASHDLALRVCPPGRAVRGQLPVAVVMVALTCAGLFALLSG
ncbi:hypothetical protein SAMN04489712_11748 [Thermomonospora echinospora]|uniref:Fenitrothion hydrolase n=1 Tax=Thermomonospora echinospora TaxID=1992 RepID=A0A1H6DHJ3_9ACTN|nr:hypothetical protein [Thermomonospora echinospora]SEG84679.1 hypothetical protein SAMN04489712_11748 [Thermomonospora echinospora]